MESYPCVLHALQALQAVIGAFRSSTRLAVYADKVSAEIEA